MKNLKQSFQSLSNKVTNQIKGCVQCNDSDCAKCKGNQNSFDYIFGSDQKLISPNCFYFAQYYSAPQNDFLNWSINGNSFNSEIGLITGNASNGINPLNLLILYDLRFAWTITNDTNTLPSLPIADTPIGQQGAIWEQGGCELKCWELFVPQTDVFFGQLFLGIPIVSFIDYQAFGLGQIDISNSTIINAIDAYYKSAFGSQAQVLSIYDGKIGGYKLFILNTYESFPPVWSNQSLGSMSFNEIICE